MASDEELAAIRDAYEAAVEETDRNPLAHTAPPGWRTSGSTVREIALSQKVIAAQDERLAAAGTTNTHLDEVRAAYEDAVTGTDSDPLAPVDPRGWRISSLMVREIDLSRKLIAAQDERLAERRDTEEADA